MNGSRNRASIKEKKYFAFKIDTKSFLALDER
jgi:hypothetical protein